MPHHDWWEVVQVESQEQPRSRMSRILALLSVVAVVASVIGTLAATRGGATIAATFSRGGSGALGAPLRISTYDTAHLRCPAGASFSPDGSQLAILGTTGNCHDGAVNRPTSGQHLLAFYDSHSGALLRTLTLDPLVGIGGHGNTPLDLAGTSTARFYSLGWSPDGKQFALAFTVFDSAGHFLPDDILASGLLTLQLPAATTAIIYGDAGFFSTSAGGYAGYPVWNITQSSLSAPAPLSPGLFYSWLDDGHLSPTVPLLPGRQNPLTREATANHPVGRPIGGQTYSIWQPGLLLGPDAIPPVMNRVAGSDAFVTAFPTWSSEGDYATLAVAAVALPLPAHVSVSGAPSGATPIYPMPAQFPEVPARDAALQALQSQIGAHGWAAVAWNPSGSLLASIACADPRNQRLQLLESATGRSAGSLSLGLSGSDTGCQDFSTGENLGDYPNPNISLGWSPDDSLLFATDQHAATLTIWQVERR
jgi:hypothetical protein